MNNKKCETVIFSDKAYNAVIRESFAKHPVETGGILLGYILDNGLWIVMEVIPPGINGVFQTAYFEYDQDFVNYLGTSVANQYKEPLQVLGLWHRHPGSMDYFSSTDDGTNAEFASKNPYGVISGLVNIDPKFRLTMYHLDHINGLRPRNVAYTKVDFEVGDDMIPEKFFALRYVDENRSDLNPTPTAVNTQATKTRPIPQAPRNQSRNEMSEEMPPAPAPPAAQPQPSVIDVASSHFGKWFKPVCFGVAALIIFILGMITGAKLFPDKEIVYETVTPQSYDEIIEQVVKLLEKIPNSTSSLIIPEIQGADSLYCSEPAIIIATLLASQVHDPTLQTENVGENANGNAEENATATDQAVSPSPAEIHDSPANNTPEGEGKTKDSENPKTQPNVKNRS